MTTTTTTTTPPSSTPVVLYVPNLLGYIRIALAFVGLCLAATASSSSKAGAGAEGEHRVSCVSACWAIAAWAFAAFLDLFDGMLARKLNQTSKFGVLLDVAADNVLRNCIWVAAAYAAAAASADDDDERQQPLLLLQRRLTMIAAALVPCLEWFTMVSTQVHAASSGGENWKLARQNDPWLIRRYFDSNFRNPLGFIGIYGLFAAGFFAYGSHFEFLRQNIPLFRWWMYASYLGRGITATIEIYFCWGYLSLVLKEDVDEKSNKKSGKEA